MIKRSAPRRSWRPSPRVLGWSLLGMGVAVVAVTVFLIVRPDGEPQAGPAPSPSPTYRYATETFTNDEGGYEFRHPEGWEVFDTGSATVAAAPERAVIVTFGHGAEGSLQEAEAELVKEIQERYRRVRLGGLQEGPIGEHQSVAVYGRARNQNRLEIRFGAITVKGPDRNYSITMFTAEGVDPAEVLPPAQEVIQSFRPLARGA